MKKVIACSLVLLAVFAHAQDDQSFIDEAKNAALSLMKDPESTRFRNMVVISKGKGRIVCGEINSKNSYGGYVGFKKFYKLENSPDAVIKGDDGIIDRLIDLACKPAEDQK